MPAATGAPPSSTVGVTTSPSRSRRPATRRSRSAPRRTTSASRAATVAVAAAARPPPRRRRACRSSTALLASPEDLRIEFDPVTNEERTGSDRPAELVTRDRDQVGILDMGGKVDPPQRLDGIGVKPRAGSVTSGDLDERGMSFTTPVSLLMAMIDTTETGWPAASRTAASRSGRRCRRPRVRL